MDNTVTPEQKEWLIEQRYIDKETAEKNEYEVYRLFDLHRNEWWNRDKQVQKSDETTLEANKEPKAQEAEVGVVNEQKSAVKKLTLEEIEAGLKEQASYWDGSRENNNGFDELHEKCIVTIEQFVKGELELEADAYEKMSEYIEIFLGDYKKEPNVLTYENAKNKLENLKSQTKAAQIQGIMTALANNKQDAQQTSNDTVTVTAEDVEVEILDKSEENLTEESIEQGIGFGGTDKERIRSNDNFDNDVEMRKIKLEVLFSKAFKDKELISEEDYKKAKDILSRIALVEDVAGKPEAKTQNYATAEEIAQAYEIIDTAEDKIAQKDEDLFHQTLSNMVVERYLNSPDEKILNKNLEQDYLLTPEILATAIDGYNRQLKRNKFENDEQRKQVEHKLEMAVHYAKGQIYDLAKKQNYFFVDITNAPDIHDGYVHAINVCREYDEAKSKEAEKQAEKEDVSRIKSNNESANKIYDQAQKMLDEYIKPYDELYNIPAKTDNPIKARNIAIDINDNIRFYNEVIDKMEFNEASLGEDGHEFLETLKNFKIVSSYKEDGAPEYENCIEEKEGKLSVVKGSSLEAILRSTALDEAMKKLNGKVNKKEAQKELMEAVKTNAYEILMAYEQAEKTVKAGLGEEINKFTDPKYAEEFRAKLQQQEVAISPLAMDLAIKRNATKVEAYGNRLKQNLGVNATSFIRASLKDQLIKLDSRLSHENKEKYGNNAKAVRRAGLRRAWVGCAIGSVVAFGASYGITKLSAKSAISAALARKVAGANPGVAAELGVGGLNAMAGAVAGAAISTVAYLGTKKISAMIKGQKYTWKDVKNEFKDPKTYAIIATGALSGASVGFALSGCPQCATYCGIAAFGAGAVAKFIGPYKDLRASGQRRSLAALNAIAIAATTTGAGLFGHHLGMQGIEAQQTEVTLDQNKAKELVGKSDEELAQQGISREKVTLPSDQQPQGNGWIKTGDNHQEILEQESARALHRLERWLKPDSLEKLIKSGENQGVSRDEMHILLNKALLHTKGGIPEDHANMVTNVGQKIPLNDYASQDGLYTVTKPANPYLAGDAYQQNYGLTQGDVDKIASFIDWKNMSVRPELKETLDNVVMNADGSLRSVDLGNDATIHINDGLPANATHDAEGHLAGVQQNAGGEEVFSSYHDGDRGLKSIFERFTQTFSQKPFAAMGTLIVDLAHKAKSRLRPGALADRVEQTKKKDNPNPIPVDKWLIEEYKIIHGIEPSKAEYVRYKMLVQEEHKAEVEKGITDKPFSKEYFEDRMAQFNDKVRTSVKPLADEQDKAYQKEKAERIGKRRQEMWSLTSMTKDDKPLEVKNVTLRDFEHIATISGSGEEHAALMAARDTSKIPMPNGKKDKPHGGTFDIISKKTTGNTTNNGQGVNDGLPNVNASKEEKAKLKCSGKGCGPSRRLGGR